MASSFGRRQLRQHRRTSIGSGFLSIVALGVFFPTIAFSTPVVPSSLFPQTRETLTKYAVAAVSPLLRVIQVYPPVLTAFPNGTEVLSDGSQDYDEQTIHSNSSNCVTQQTLLVHEFANSYSNPFVGPYSPPVCDFNRVTFNLTVTAAGRQFDRLGAIYLGDIEIWRTSTAEPTSTGIVWTYLKDMSHYLSLFKEPQKLIFDLGNQITDIYTAPFEATLGATFFTADDAVMPADVIIPVSARMSSSNMPSAWQVPPSNASNTLSLPQNVNRAVFSFAATGQIDEEFWYSNVLSSEVNTFPQGSALLGYSPFREVQLSIDGMLAGVVWPFPIIFTGGIVPGFWRPIVGIDAFDLKEDEIDITPWLPVLCDGNDHTFDISIAGIDDDGKGNGALTGSVGSYWVVSGKIFLFTDPGGSITTGSTPSVEAPPPSIFLSSFIGKSSNGTNQTLTYDVSVGRQIRIASTVQTANGTKDVTWQQNLAYSSHNQLTDQGLDQLTIQDSHGTEIASLGYGRSFDYPLNVNTSISLDALGNLATIDGTINRGQDISTVGRPIFPTGLESFDNLPDVASNGPAFQDSRLQTTQNGSAHYMVVGNSSISTGSTQQDLLFEGIRLDDAEVFEQGSFPDVQGSTELFERSVLAVNGIITQDKESLVGQPVGGITADYPDVFQGELDFVEKSPMAMLGRPPLVARREVKRGSRVELP